MQLIFLQSFLIRQNEKKCQFETVAFIVLKMYKDNTFFLSMTINIFEMNEVVVSEYRTMQLFLLS